MSELVYMTDGRSDGPLIVWLHAVGGGVTVYKPSAQFLSTFGQSVGFSFHPSSFKTAYIESVESLAKDYYAQIEEKFTGRELVFIGWCTGGLIAYEMARISEAGGRKAVPTVLIDTLLQPELAFSSPVTASLWLDQVKWMTFAAIVFGEDLYACLKTEPTFWRAATQERLVRLGELGGNAGRVTKLSFLQTYWRFYESSWRACRVLYEPEQCNSPILYLKASDLDDHGSIERWRRLAPRLSAREMEGSHVSILAGPSLDLLCSLITSFISKHVGAESGA